MAPMPLVEPSTSSPSAPQSALSFSLIAKVGAGNYGSLESHLRADFSTKLVSEQLTASRDTSDGFIPDRNYSSNALASEISARGVLPFGTTKTSSSLQATGHGYGG